MNVGSVPICSRPKYKNIIALLNRARRDVYYNLVGNKKPNGQTTSGRGQ